MNINKVEPRIYKVMDEADKAVGAFDLDPKLKELVKVRVSQLNGCGYCINYHTKDARKLGETERRLYGLSAWWETPFFTEEERAILKFTDEVTLISEGGVSDETFGNALKFLGEKKIAQLIFIISTTGTWNRLAISTHMIAEND
jgi:AhpD family alkylhydroperoxidase